MIDNYIEPIQSLTNKRLSLWNFLKMLKKPLGIGICLCIVGGFFFVIMLYYSAATKATDLRIAVENVNIAYHASPSPSYDHNLETSLNALDTALINFIHPVKILRALYLMNDSTYAHAQNLASPCNSLYYQRHKGLTIVAYIPSIEKVMTNENLFLTGLSQGLIGLGKKAASALSKTAF